VRLIENLAADWRALDTRIAVVTAYITLLVKEDEHCQQLVSVLGVRPLITSAMVAAIETTGAFAIGRSNGLAQAAAQADILSASCVE
jgi:hypothetical protein